MAQFNPPLESYPLAGPPLKPEEPEEPEPAPAHTHAPSMLALLPLAVYPSKEALFEAIQS
jgi:hypothetical protein